MRRLRGGPDGGKRKGALTQQVLTGVLVLLIAVPLAIAALHPGFAGAAPAPDPGQVWVTSAERGLAARVNQPIEELDASIALDDPAAEVLQGGGEAFLVDRAAGIVGRLDPAAVELRERISVPVGAEVDWAAGVLSILEPASGRLWAVPTDVALAFDAQTSDPIATLGANARAAVAEDGAVVAYGPASSAIIRLPKDGALQRTVLRQSAMEDVEISAVGARPVLLDRDRSVLVFDDGREAALAANAIRLQEPGPAAEHVVVATADAMLLVPFRGDKVESISSGGSSARDGADPDPLAVARPVRIGPCVYGAWGMTAAVASQCAGQQAKELRITDPLRGGELRFRVSGEQIVLNNLATGAAYLPDRNLRVVEGWDRLAPAEAAEPPMPEPDALARLLAGRTAQNHAPELVDDVAGVRPGRTAIIPVLANDADSDGDLLVVDDLRGEVPAEFGEVALVDGGRAVQVRAAEGASGSVQLEYIAGDGRPGGVARAYLTIRAADEGANAAPETGRLETAAVELGQSASVEVLSGWTDPDGDHLRLVAAEGSAQTAVRFTPDGTITATASGGEPGVREVEYRVSDGVRESFGRLRLDVRAAGSLAPIAAPDAVAGEAGGLLAARVLENDRAPSGQPIALTGIRELDGASGSAAFDAASGEVTLATTAPGTYYVEYAAAAGAAATHGLVRFDVLEPGSGAASAAPTAAQDVVFLAPGAQASIDLTANDISPSGRVLGVAGIDLAPAAEAPGLAIELLDRSIARISSTAGLPHEIRIPYTVGDGLASAAGELVIVQVGAPADDGGPRAADDAVRLRAGEAASVPVLANDRSVQPLSLDQRLLSPVPAGGAAFVDGDRVAIVAPDAPGLHAVTYGVTDARGRQARASLAIEVVAIDEAANAPPAPAERVARVGAGEAIRIDLPLTGLDPDGDATTLREVLDAPQLGEVREIGPSWIVYAARPDAGGTEELRYTLDDGHHGVGEGVLRIGVVQPEGAAAPLALDDVVRLRPDRTTTIAPLANDAHPAGLGIALEAPDPGLAGGAELGVEGDLLRIRPPAGASFLSIPYEIRSADGSRARALIHVVVDPAAPLPAPTARDVAAPAAAPGEELVLDPRDGAVNPSGTAAELTTRLGAAHAAGGGAPARVRLLDDGRVAVVPGAARTIVPVELVDPATGLAGGAILLVPAAS